MLKWVFGADTSPFRRSLNDMRNDVRAFSSSAKSQLAGLFGIGAITAWVTATLDAAGRIEDLSRRLNVSAESFQRLSYASQLSGGSMEVVGKALTILTKNLEEAKKGGEAFTTAAKTLNLNLAELATMSPEGQMIELARGYQQSTDKAAALAAIMKLLGKSGGELVPMLADGPEALEQMLGEATVATNEQIAAMAKLGDAMDAFKMKGVAALGSIIDGFKIFAAYAEYALNKVFGNDVADSKLEERMDSIMHGVKDPDRSGAGAAADSAKEQLEIEKEKAKLADEIAKLEEDARIKSLSLAEKILDAEKRRAELAAESIFGDDEVKALEARREQLKVEQEIAGYRKEQADEDKRTADRKGEADAEIKSLTERGAALDRENKMAGMSDADQRELLKSERSKAISDRDAANARGDTKGGLEAGNKARELTGQIDDITRTLSDDLLSKLADAKSAVPTIATSTLSEIGGGGGARLMENDQQRRMVDLLAQIAANTAGGSDGAKPPEPI